MGDKKLKEIQKSERIGRKDENLRAGKEAEIEEEKANNKIT